MPPHVVVVLKARPGQDRVVCFERFPFFLLRGPGCAGNLPLGRDMYCRVKIRAFSALPDAMYHRMSKFLQSILLVEGGVYFLSGCRRRRRHRELTVCGMEVGYSGTLVTRRFMLWVAATQQCRAPSPAQNVRYSMKP